MPFRIPEEKSEEQRKRREWYRKEPPANRTGHRGQDQRAEDKWKARGVDAQDMRTQRAAVDRRLQINLARCCM